MGAALAIAFLERIGAQPVPGSCQDHAQSSGVRNAQPGGDGPAGRLVNQQQASCSARASWMAASSPASKSDSLAASCKGTPNGADRISIQSGLLRIQAATLRWSAYSRKFVEYRVRNHDTGVKATKQINAIDQNEVVDGRGVGNDDLHLIRKERAVSASRSTSSTVRDNSTPWDLRNPSIS